MLPQGAWVKHYELELELEAGPGDRAVLMEDVSLEVNIELTSSSLSPPPGLVCLFVDGC